MSRHVRTSNYNLRATESRDHAINRMANEGRVRGVKVWPLGASYVATDPAHKATHRVTLVSCDCFAFVRFGKCQHHAVLLAELDQLPKEAA